MANVPDRKFDSFAPVSRNAKPQNHFQRNVRKNKKNSYYNDYKTSWVYD